MHYSHTQKGTLIKILIAGAIVILLGIAGSNGWNAPLKLWWYGIVLLLILVMWLFGSLTVEVNEEELTHFFGPGFWKKTYLLNEIESVKQVRNSWIFGWGIRITPHGWLYNVSGLDAVEITLRSGKKFRIGTDQSSELTSGLQGVIKTN
jgi:hypothetical protein